MTRSHKILGFLLLAGFGIYGCAKGPTGGTGSSGSSGNSGTDRHPSLEAKAQRLEEDFRSAATARDQFRRQLLASEEKLIQIQKQFEQERFAAATERETLKAEIKTRLTERDVVQSHFDGFRKNLKELLAQSESNPSSPIIPIPPAAVGVQSIPPASGSALSN